MDPFCYLCFVSYYLVFLTALWSPTGKGLTSWLSCTLCFLVVLSFSHICPGLGVVFNCMDS